MNESLAVIDSDAAGNVGPPESTAPGGWSDWVGMVASIGCAIHCAAMPFVIAYLPALGLSFLADEAFHKWMAVICFFIAVSAFVPGLRKHGRWTPVSIASVGLVMISVAAFGLAGECCPSCAAAASASAANSPAAHSPAAHSPADGAMAVVSADAAVCTDPDCPLCPSEGTGAAPTVVSIDSPAPLATAPPPVSPWISRIAPWLTPIGGAVLVSAHLLNRRYGCLCGCCGSDSPQGEPE